MNLYTTLKTLCLVPSISGRENGIRAKLTELITPLVDEIKVDNMGNLIALKRGKIRGGKKFMLCAHMDEIGFLVTFIEENGMLRVANVGGINFVANAFGKVVSGMEVVDEIASIPTDYSDKPKVAMRMKKVSLV